MRVLNIYSMEIPKIIHYCWFGHNPLPELAQKCISSWREYLPDYEIKEWNEDNFDVNIIPYTAEAYESKKYAFVSDYARFWILYHYGGLYFDTDVEIIKPMDEIIACGPFMGCEKEAGKGNLELGVNPGLGIGATVNLGIYKEMLDFYNGLSFAAERRSGVETVVTYTTRFFCSKGLVDTNEVQCIDGVYIYPKEYFCPKSYKTGKLDVTERSVSIHHYHASWVPLNEKIERKFWQLLGLTPHRFMWHLNQFFGNCKLWRSV